MRQGRARWLTVGTFLALALAVAGQNPAIRPEQLEKEVVVAAAALPPATALSELLTAGYSFGESGHPWSAATEDGIFDRALALHPPADAGRDDAAMIAQLKSQAARQAVAYFLEADLAHALALARRADGDQQYLYDTVLARAWGGRRDNFGLPLPRSAADRAAAAALGDVVALLAEEQRATGTFPYRSAMVAIGQAADDGLGPRRPALIDRYFAALGAETDPRPIGLAAEAAFDADQPTDAWLWGDSRWAPTAVALLQRVYAMPADRVSASAAEALVLVLRRVAPGALAGLERPAVRYPVPGLPLRVRRRPHTGLEPAAADAAARFAGLVEQARLQPPAAAGVAAAQAYALLQQHPEFWRTDGGYVAAVRLTGLLRFQRQDRAQALLAPLLAATRRQVVQLQSVYNAQPSAAMRDLFACRVGQGERTLGAVSSFTLDGAVVVMASLDAGKAKAMIERSDSFLKPQLLGSLLAYPF